MFIRYSDGSCVEGVIQRLEGGILRAAVAGAEDAVEFALAGADWISETGDVVTFEFPIDSELDLWLGLTGERGMACAAGGECVLRRLPDSGSVVVN